MSQNRRLVKAVRPSCCSGARVWRASADDRKPRIELRRKTKQFVLVAPNAVQQNEQWWAELYLYTKEQQGDHFLPFKNRSSSHKTSPHSLRAEVTVRNQS
jgi:hypothetical protein